MDRVNKAGSIMAGLTALLAQAYDAHCRISLSTQLVANCMSHAHTLVKLLDCQTRWKSHLREEGDFSGPVAPTQ